jgi:intein/homing endonuclease
MAVYAALSEEEAYLWAILSDESGLDQAEFALIDDTVMQDELDADGRLVIDSVTGLPRQIRGDGCFRAWPFQWPWWRSEDQLQIDRASRCLSEGTLILTKNGWKEIQDVCVGDEVLTHKNRWRPVTNVFNEGIKPTVRITGQGHPTGLVATENHKFWARHARRASLPKDGHKRSKMEDAAWIKAEEFRKRDGSQVLATRWSSPAAQTPAVEFQRYLEPAYVSGQQNFVEDVLSENFIWLMGLYVAEGSVFIDEQYSKVSWSIHRKEVDEVTQRISELGLNYNVYYRKTDLSAIVCINSRPIALWVKDNFAGKARTKQIPSWIYSLPEHHRRNFFDGMVYGDGYVRPSGRIEYSTSSKALAYGVKILGQTLGLAASMNLCKAPDYAEIRGKQIFPSDSYAVSFDKSSTVIFEDGMAWVGIHDVVDAGDNQVYDIEVQDDHSYIAEGIVVHNSVGKSLSIKLRAFAFPFVNPGEEMIITAPEGVHLDAVTDNVETLYTNCRLAREMISRGRGGIKHRPFLINFSNGSRIMGRIPQRDGKGIKGTHPLWLEMDEASDWPEAAWAEIIETVKVQNPKARWRAHGVTRGVGGGFDERCQPDSGWKVHALPAMYRPNWTEEERQKKIKEYGGSIEAVDYRRNVLGLPGDQNSPIFVLYRLMENVDIDSSSDFNLNEYISLDIDESMVREVGCIEQLLDVPGTHSRYENFWIGMDVGWCVDDQTQILTRRGWLNYDELLIGDESLSVNPETGLSEWHPVTDIYKNVGPYEMVHMKGQSFDAMTTPHHKWLVKDDSGSLRWKTTETLNTKDRIMLSTDRAYDEDSDYSDDFVRLVAWIFCEGTLLPYDAFELSQSHIKNPYHTEEIRQVLVGLFGQDGLARHGFGWREVLRFEGEDNHESRHGGAMTYFTVSTQASREVGLNKVFLSKEKELDPRFLSSLNQKQLEIFIEVCEKGDGWSNDSGTVCFEQASEKRSSSYQMACALAGYPISTSYSEASDRTRWHTKILKADTVSPVKAASSPRVNGSTQAMTITKDRKLRIIWCPTIKHHNWLARRNGSVYFTGNTIAPSSITVFAEVPQKRNEETKLKLVAKILLKKVSTDDQAAAIIHLIDLYRPRAFAIDSTGAGFPLVQTVQTIARKRADIKHIVPRIKGYNFSEKVIAEFDDTVKIDENNPDGWEAAAVKRNVLEWSTDVLRGLVDKHRLILPYDKSIIGEFQGQTWTYSKSALDAYGRKKLYSAGSFHTLDATRMAVLAYQQEAINEFIKSKEDVWKPPPMVFL